MPLGPQGGTRSRTRARNDVDVVNIMTFDYYDRVTRDMGSAAISAAQGLLNRLTTQNPSKTTSELWAMEGNTILPGLDDYPRKTEATSLADAQRLLTFAESNAVGMLSMWAVQRDNGGCPGRPDRTAAPESSRIPGTSAACLRRSRAAS